ncbi:MAG: hypothetical protein D6795_01330, partial [Deltaproteobacteria bacterium]
MQATIGRRGTSQRRSKRFSPNRLGGFPGKRFGQGQKAPLHRGPVSGGEVFAAKEEEEGREQENATKGRGMRQDAASMAM